MDDATGALVLEVDRDFACFEAPGCAPPFPVEHPARISAITVAKPSMITAVVPVGIDARVRQPGGHREREPSADKDVATMEAIIAGELA
jgi:hypothetical protein